MGNDYFMRREEAVSLDNAIIRIEPFIHFIKLCAFVCHFHPTYATRTIIIVRYWLLVKWRIHFRAIYSFDNIHKFL